MKSKLFGLFAFSIFTLIVLMGIGSATIFSDDFTDSSLTEWTINPANSWTHNTGNFAESTNFSSSNLSKTISTSGFQDIVVKYDRKLEGFDSTDRFTVWWSSDGVNFDVLDEFSGTASDSGFVPQTLNINSSANDNSNFTIKFECSVDRDDEFCKIDNVVVEGTATSTPTTQQFCRDGSVNDNNLLLDVDVRNRGQGDDDNWMPLDHIEVDVEFDNDKDLDGDGDLDDVILELGIFQEGSTRNIADEMLWISSGEEEIQVGDVDEGEDVTHTFEFRVNPDEFDEGSYVLMVKAFPDGDESETCIDHSDRLTDFGSSEFFADIEIEFEGDDDRMIVVDDFDALENLVNVQCGATVSLEADVWHIGDDDNIAEDQIRVTLVNQELGIDVEETVLGDLDIGERKTVFFNFNVPQDAEEKIHTLSMRTFYDYNDNNGVYRESSADTFFAYLDVENCGISPSDVSVSASLVSGGKAGGEMVVQATILNQASETKTYSVSASGYNSWADSVNVDTPTVFLSPGQSQEVLFTFDVKRDAAGTQDFAIDVSSDGKSLAQPVSVTIEPRNFLGITGFATGGNAYLWGLGILNIILIILVIVVAVRIARRRRSA